MHHIEEIDQNVARCLAKLLWSNDLADFFRLRTVLTKVGLRCLIIEENRLDLRFGRLCFKDVVRSRFGVVGFACWLMCKGKGFLK